MTEPLTARTDSPITYGEIDFDHEDSNRSNNRYFGDVLDVNLRRRRLLQGGVAGAVAAGLFAQGLNLALIGKARADELPDGIPLGFQAVPLGVADTITVPAGYTATPAFAWGEPIVFPYPAFRPDGSNSADDQRRQIGMHHDGMHYFPLGEGEQVNRRGLLVMNHEYIQQDTLHPAGIDFAPSQPRDPFEVLKEVHAHGVSVFEIARDENATWRIVRSRYNRRIHAGTVMNLSGPVRGHDKVRTAFSPSGTRTRGTINNCAHGHTPWNTYLTCEENWAGYFANRDSDRPREQTRYGTGATSRYGWDTVDPRFDAARKGDNPRRDYRNNPNTMGWIVEIDPFAPNSRPIKRTALGRFAHEAIVFAEPVEGQPMVAYSGDDSTFEYIYKFVSAQPYRAGLTDGSILDTGTLYVARFNDDGSGEWLPLDIDDSGFRAAAEAAGVEFADQGDVLINTRIAADVVGATRMDRPEWGAIDPKSGDVYFCLTNNTRRSSGQVDAANPRAGNATGHIIRWTEAGSNPAALHFGWDIFLLSGGPDASLGPDGNPLDADSSHASPDGLWFDASGLLWIQTDMSGSQLLGSDGQLSGSFGNNQMLVANPATGEIKRFLVGPVGCEVTGVVSTPDRRTLFVNIQHPGEQGPIPDGRSYSSNWPDGGDARPRSSTVIITKDDGGIIGT